MDVVVVVVGVGMMSGVVVENRDIDLGGVDSDDEGRDMVEIVDMAAVIVIVGEVDYVVEKVGENIVVVVDIAVD